MCTRMISKDNIIMLYSFLFLCTVLFTPYIRAHVALTFPQGRKVNLDSLTNMNTKTVCGMPRGWIRTSIPTGMYMNFTWNMAYPHQGGYRIELLDGNYKWLTNLTELKQGQEFLTGNPTAQWHIIKTPEILCTHCVVRLVRQAKEFGETVQYISCSDVDIVDRKTFKNKCYGHGIPHGNLCFCYRGYSGPLCQYKEECDSDIDCSGRGRCVRIGGTNHPSRQCFCAPGFHGEKCLLANSAVLPSHYNLNLAMYKKHILNERVLLHYRMVYSASEMQSEIEFVLEISGSSFGALGLRPNYFNESCKLWPPIDEYVTASMSNPKESVLNNNWYGISDLYSDAYQNYSHLDYNPHLATRTFHLNIAKVNNQKILRPSEYAPVMGHFSGMDCTDITIGAAQGIFSRIRDYYTREMGTPQLDEDWGGWDDITSATGWEMNGKTTLIFRKKMWPIDLTDHPISGDMHVIWARGQESGAYVHGVPSGLEVPEGTPSNMHFYTTDEIKYHGHGMQRGITVINFAV